MDPVATLIEAHAAAKACDVERCTELLTAYHNWRIKGGFEPVIGDVFARAIREMLQ